jgi:hypothetical protein
VDERLPGRVLAEARVYDDTHYYLFNVGLLDLGPLDRLLDNDGAEPWGRYGRKGALELPDGRSDCADNDRVYHDIPPFKVD